MADDRLLTVAEAAHLIGAKPRTVRRWIDDGRLTAYVVGPTRRIRIKQADVAALLPPTCVGAFQGRDRVRTA